MDNTITYRQATVDDLSLLLDWTLALMEHEKVDDSLELPVKDDINTHLNSWMSGLIDNDNSLVIIAEDSAGEPIGTILGLIQLALNDFVDAPLHGLIQMIWIAEEHRNKGVASNLLQYMEESFKSLNIPYCEIQYSTSNREAEGFWLNSGYSVVSHTSRKMLT